VDHALPDEPWAAAVAPVLTLPWPQPRGVVAQDVGVGAEVVLGGEVSAEGRVSARNIGVGGATGLNGAVRAQGGRLVAEEAALPPAATLVCAPAFGTTDGMLV
jgi:predicted acyltransferase (DUF342 family)